MISGLPLLRVFFIVALVACGEAAHAAEPYQPKIAAASDEAEKGLSRIKVPEGTAAKLVAAEPQLANPVAFWIDGRGRFYVCETFRQGNAVTDNRGMMHWLDDDLAARTVADRLAYHKKHLKEKLVDFTKEHDRIRLLEDRDGDGVVDHDSIFTTGYNEVVDGTGAGVLEHRGNVYYTNIPHLWKLRDTNGDGVADEKTSLHEGYGVRVAFRGHDMHGLTVGPDGRIYFSIGDRGFNVEFEGQRFEYPDQGAVFRCEPDGSRLEIVHLGLRNPQELAFDEYGRLFTGDNNSDGGDKARWVQIVDGGETGWRMYYQYLDDRGPWNREKLWHPRHDGQAAYIVPPIDNLGNGPSGLAYYPGVGLPERFNQHFFLCDFRGQDSNSGIRTFALKPKGASFEIVDSQETVWSVLATDCDFGPDGALYLSDWVEGWNGPGKGRIYKIEDGAFQSSGSKALAALFAKPFSERSEDELFELLSHPHFKVRLEAQWALVGKGKKSARDKLLTAAKEGKTTQTRLHGIWGLGQHARWNGGGELAAVVTLFDSPDPHVRAQLARILGEVPGPEGKGVWRGSVKHLLPRLRIESDPHAKLECINALGRVGGPELLTDLIQELARVNDTDPYLRNALALALARVCGLNPFVPADSPNKLDVLRFTEFTAVRRGAVLALRRLKSPKLAQYLDDTDTSIVEEAARAIHDLPVTAGYEALANLDLREKLTEPTWWRVVNANYRLDRPAQVAAIAARDDVPLAARLEAVRALGAWDKPSGRDRVLGDWRPLTPRSDKKAGEALKSVLPKLLAGDAALRQATLDTGVKLRLAEVVPALAAIVADKSQGPRERSEAMTSLGTLNPPDLPEILKVAVRDDAPAVRSAARTVLARYTPAEAEPLLLEALEKGQPLEVQSALRALPLLGETISDRIVGEQLARFVKGELPAEARLDAIEVALKSKNEQVRKTVEAHFEKEPATDLLRGYRETLLGGDAQRGRSLFFDKAEVSCSRCHVAGGHGGEVGPNLSKVGTEKTREYLLTSLVHPDHEIAKGFETLVVETTEGTIVSGIVKQETETHLKLMTPEAKLVEIAKSDIVEKARGKSGMPADLVKKLSREEVRDLIEYLATQKGMP
jgi:quinoprotein glucose dehydrogenase